MHKFSWTVFSLLWLFCDSAFALRVPSSEILREKIHQVEVDLVFSESYESRKLYNDNKWIWEELFLKIERCADSEVSTKVIADILIKQVEEQLPARVFFVNGLSYYPAWLKIFGPLSFDFLKGNLFCIPKSYTPTPYILGLANIFFGHRDSPEKKEFFDYLEKGRDRIYFAKTRFGRSVRMFLFYLLYREWRPVLCELIPNLPFFRNRFYYRMFQNKSIKKTFGEKYD